MTHATRKFNWRRNCAPYIRVVLTWASSKITIAKTPTVQSSNGLITTGTASLIPKRKGPGSFFTATVGADLQWWHWLGSYKKLAFRSGSPSRGRGVRNLGRQA